MSLLAILLILITATPTPLWGKDNQKKASSSSVALALKHCREIIERTQGRNRAINSLLKKKTLNTNLESDLCNRVADQIRAQEGISSKQGLFQTLLKKIGLNSFFLSSSQAEAKNPSSEPKQGWAHKIKEGFLDLVTGIKAALATSKKRPPSPQH